METKFPQYWMWSEAFEMLARAERMHRQFFQPARSSVAWEPPVDVLETDRDVLIFVAVPGVAPGGVDTVIDGNDLIISGKRTYPAEMGTASIHRLELPQGRFERRVPLPPGRYAGVERAASNGCLQITLHKAESGND
ncbi:MAG TPA: Hsp20/alpha crystallin family protein [Roseiarcus sp.]|nr:Hsp20/alpha crystallin family protein [Roseiarcus sp.]